MAFGLLCSTKKDISVLGIVPSRFVPKYASVYLSVNPLVSVIIPTYNHATALPACLTSVLAQTYQPLEIIVVDDGSTDHTQDVLRAYTDRIVVIKQENAGSNPARNRGWHEAKGEYLLFCDADLVLRSEMITKMVQVLETHPDVSFAYSPFRFGWKRFVSPSWNPERLRQANYIHTSSLIRAKDFFGFDERIKRLQDWDIWLTFLARGKKGVLVPEELFSVAIHGTSRIGSQWLPSIAYKIPWQMIGWMPKRIKKYFDARTIIQKKHHLEEV